MRKLGQKDASGNNDPNVMTVEDGAKIRLVSDAIASWKQHIIEHPKDEEQVVFVTCPGPRTCPLCRKPQAFQEDGKGGKELVQLFPVQRRRAANVWDYKTNQVKVLIGGPQIFNNFDDAVNVGVDPMGADYVIRKTGQRMTTKYSLIRVDAPVPAAFNEDQLIDLTKYEQADSVESIFEKLDAYGIDYDALPLPKFELDDALAFEMPYGKHKGMTLEALAAQDDGYLQYMHGVKLDSGALGDPVFQAIHTVLLDLGLVENLDEDGPSGVMPTRESQTQAAPAAPAMIKLVDQNGEHVEVPASAKDALLAAGYTEPVAAPEPEGQPSTVTLVGPDGGAITVPAEAAPALLAAGYRDATEDPGQDAPVERADSDEVVIDIGGTQATMPWGTAKGLIDSGTAKLAEEAAPAAPQFTPPGDEDQVKVKLNVVPTPIDMAWKDALRLTIEGQAALIDPDQQAYAQRLADSGDSEAVAAQAQTEQSDPSAVPPPPDPDKPFSCEICDWAGKTQGGLTQHMNRVHPVQAAAGSTSAAPAPSANGHAGESLLDEVKKLVANSAIAKDYNKLLAVFEQATGGERNLGQMDDEQLTKVRDAIQAQEAVA